MALTRTVLAYAGKCGGLGAHLCLLCPMFPLRRQVRTDWIGIAKETSALYAGSLGPSEAFYIPGDHMSSTARWELAGQD